MRLTGHTDYSLRVLMYLNQKKQLCTLNSLAEELQISRNNLIKVSNQLEKSGFIETVKGRTGGLRITKDAGEKTIRDIIIQTEENFRIAECFSADKRSCTFLKGCLLKRSLQKALDSFLDSLAQVTLNDVTPKTRGH